MKYVLPFSAMDEDLTYVTAHLIYKKKTSTKDSRSIPKQNTQFFTSEKLIDLIVIFFFSYNYQFIDV